MRNTKCQAFTKNGQRCSHPAKFIRIRNGKRSKFICGLHTNAVKVTFR